MTRSLLVVLSLLVSSPASAQCLAFSIDAPRRDAAPAAAADSRVTADFNNDGRDDYAGVEDGMVAIYLNRGDGTFEKRSTTFSAYQAEYAVAPPIAVADFNGDGFADVLFGVSPKLALGDGDGGFLYPDPTPVYIPFYATTLTVGDFNGDRIPDFAATRAEARLTGLFVGNGNGHFDAFQAVTGPANGIRAADMDGDRRDDIIGFSGNLAYVVWAPPSSHPAPFWSGPFGTQINDVQAADLDGDRQLDLIVLDTYDVEMNGRSGVVSLLNDGNGGFLRKSQMPIDAWSMWIGDKNGDGVVDAVVDGIVFLGRGDGSFRDLRRIPGVAADFAVAADLDGDGDDDIVARSWVPATQFDYYDTAVLWNDAPGTFRIQAINNRDRGGVVLAADFDDDGRDEIVTAMGVNLYVLKVSNDGEVREVAHFTAPRGSNESSVTAGRFRRDQKLEVAVASYGGRLEIFDVAEPGAPRVAFDMSSSAGYLLRAADMNGDGVDDLVVTGRGNLSGHMHDYWPSKEGFVSAYLSDGWTFAGEQRLLDRPTSPLDGLAVGDFDLDGAADVITSEVAADPPWNPVIRAVVLFGDGRGNVRRQDIMPLWLSAGPRGFAVDDIDGDRFPDVVSSIGTVLFGSRDGLKAGPNWYLPGPQPIFVRQRPGAIPSIAVPVRDAPEMIFLTPQCGGRLRAVRR